MMAFPFLSSHESFSGFIAYITNEVWYYARSQYHQIKAWVGYQGRAQGPNRKGADTSMVPGEQGRSRQATVNKLAQSETDLPTPTQTCTG